MTTASIRPLGVEQVPLPNVSGTGDETVVAVYRRMLILVVLDAMLCVTTSVHSKQQ